jgi:formamidopyrimidine-DNA glycosylase
VPELPDIELYLHALRPRVVGASLTRLRIASPFLLRTVEPPPSILEGRSVLSVGRLGKRIRLDFEGDVHLVIHLMIAGRLRWREPDAKLPRRFGLAALDFPLGTLLLTEAGSKRRAALFVVNRDGLAALDPGGTEIEALDAAGFANLLRAEQHTLKRALTDPRVFSGIGNAYSDEILHHARLSPFKLTRDLSADEASRLFTSACSVLADWRSALIVETGDAFPEKVTAFREGMAVHGRFGKPCPECGSPVQRVVYAENEMNYCAVCQTKGRLLADRSLSRLLKGDWPRTIEELEAMKRDRTAPNTSPSTAP